MERLGVGVRAKEIEGSMDAVRSCTGSFKFRPFPLMILISGKIRLTQVSEPCYLMLNGSGS